jgi:hypothetical protein
MQNTGIFLSSVKVLKFNYKIMSLISISGIAASMFILSFLNQYEYFVALYGIAFGLFIGYGYLAPIKNCYDYLP